jgi:hypothetical protein
MKKSLKLLVWLSKMILGQHFFVQFAEAGKRQTQFLIGQS